MVVDESGARLTSVPQPKTHVGSKYQLDIKVLLHWLSRCLVQSSSGVVLGTEFVM